VGLYPYIPAAPKLHPVTENLSTHLIVYFATDQNAQAVVWPLKFSCTWEVSKGFTDLVIENYTPILALASEQILKQR